MLTPCYNQFFKSLILFTIICNVIGFNVQRSSDSLARPSSSYHHGRSSGAHEHRQQQQKQQHEQDDDEDEPMEAKSGHHQTKPKANYLSDQEFQQARDWKGYADDWDKKVEDDLTNQFKPNQRQEYNEPRNNPNHSKEDHEDQEEPSSDKSKKSEHQTENTEWDWNKKEPQGNGKWTFNRKSKDGKRIDFGKTEKFNQRSSNSDNVNHSDEGEKVTGVNLEKEDDQVYGGKFGEWKLSRKSGDHHKQSGHHKHTSHSNKFDPKDSFKGWD